MQQAQTPPPASGRARPPASSHFHNAPTAPDASPDVQHTPPRRGWFGTATIVFIAVAVLLLGVRVIVRGNAAGQAAPAPVVTVTVAGTPAIPTTTGSASPPPALVAGPNDPSGIPMPKGDLAGWKQTFSDDFTGSKLSKKWVAYDGKPRGDDADMFASKEISVAHGMVTLGESQQGSIYNTGGMSNVPSFSQTYGKFEVRFRMDEGWGVPYAILLWPSNNKTTPEIDFAEDNGGDRTMTSASLHPTVGDLVHKETHGDYTTWHTAEVVWSPGKIVYSLDGVVWETMTGSEVPSTTKMSLAIQTEVHPCGLTWEECPNKTTPARVNLQVDWVAAYSATKN